MATAEMVLAVARGELGTKEHPANSNRVKYNAWYYGRDVEGKAYPWCMVFVQWCFAQAGGEGLLALRTASCAALMWAAQKAGLWVSEDFQPGDVAIYDFPRGGGTDHTGIVERIDAGAVTAIESNTSQAGTQSDGGQVCRKVRLLRQIVGAVRPRFKEKSMDISNLSDKEVLELGKRLLEVMGKQAVSEKLTAELAEARDRGITDGANPGAFRTRAQAAVMTLRAVKINSG